MFKIRRFLFAVFLGALIATLFSHWIQIIGYSRKIKKFQNEIVEFSNSSKSYTELENNDFNWIVFLESKPPLPDSTLNVLPEIVRLKLKKAQFNKKPPYLLFIGGKRVVESISLASFSPKIHYPRVIKKDDIFIMEKY